MAQESMEIALIKYNRKNLVQERAFGIFYRLGGDCAGDQRFDRGDHL